MRFPLFACLSCIALSLPAYAGTFDLSFQHVAESTGAPGAHGMVVADFNNDGHDDLAHQAYDRVQITYTVPGLGLSESGPAIEQGGGTRLERGDDFGEELAAADFNLDGYMDLAVGVPNENWGRPVDTGLVQIYLGSANGTFQPVANLIPASAKAGDWFGRSLAVGDFNDDGWPDLAASAHGEGNGAVYVMYGGPHDELGWPIPSMTSADRYVMQDVGALSIGIASRFGAAIATGDFDADGIDDLALTAKWAYCDRLPDCGYLGVLHGTPEGLSPMGYGSPLSTYWEGDRQFHRAGMDSSHREQLFLPQLAVGDFDNDGVDDLAFPSYSGSDQGKGGRMFIVEGVRDRGLFGTVRHGPEFGHTADLVTGITMADLDGDHKDDIFANVLSPHRDKSGYYYALNGTNSGNLNPDILYPERGFYEHAGPVVNGHFGTCSVSNTYYFGQLVDCSYAARSVVVRDESAVLAGEAN
jgi:hypothetical protein